MIGLDKTLPLLLALCITLLPACTEKSRTSLDITEKDAREGDLAFRRGVSRHSRAVGMVSTQYSHVGIVVDSGGGNLRVVHAVAGEPRFPGDRDSVRMDRLADFYRADRAEAGCLMRPADKKAAHIAAQTALKLWRRGTPFDGAFDETDTTAMYCTELAAYAYRLAGHDIAGKRRRTLPLPWTHESCITPDQLLSCPLLKRAKTADTSPKDNAH